MTTKKPAAVKSRHAIIGGGNLGLDLHREISHKAGGLAAVYSKGLNGFDARDLGEMRRVLAGGHFSNVWYCVGRSSTDSTVDDELKIVNTLLDAVDDETRVTVFSCDSAAHELAMSDPSRQVETPRSDVARIKVAVEQSIQDRDRAHTTIVRVSALYGTSYRLRCFPGRLLADFGSASDPRVALPCNLVTPTSTLWLAGLLVDRLDEIHSQWGAKTIHVAPRGNVTVRDWGIMILDGLRSHQDIDRQGSNFDSSRPVVTNLGCSLPGGRRAPHWHDVWRRYFHRPLYLSHSRRSFDVAR